MPVDLQHDLDLAGLLTIAARFRVFEKFSYCPGPFLRLRAECIRGFNEPRLFCLSQVEANQFVFAARVKESIGKSRERPRLA